MRRGTTPAVHRDLALSAAENGVSLKRLINALITGWGGAYGGIELLSGAVMVW